MRSITKGATSRFPPAICALVLLAGAAGALRGAEGRAVLRGEISLSLRGPGAAPFGIAAALLGGTSIGYNLARLQAGGAGRKPTRPLPSDESYQGTLHFTLEPAAVGSGRWRLAELFFDYDAVDRTQLSYKEAELADAMNDAGQVAWRKGQWTGPADWHPPKPEINLRIFPAPTPEDCEAEWASGLLATLRRLGADTSDWARCYELTVRVAHPLRPSGESHWKSPMGEVRLVARDGRLSFSGKSALDVSDLKPLLEMAPPEAKPYLDQGFELYEQMHGLLSGGMVDLEPDLDMTWDETFRGVLGKDRVLEDEAFTILSGAMAHRTLSLEHLRFVLEKTPLDWRPVGQRETYFDDFVDVTARVSGPVTSPVNWRFTLFEVSREPGIHLNSRSDGVELDLELTAADNPKFKPPEERYDGWRIETAEPTEEATLRIRSRDYGAWGKLRAEAEVAPGQWVPAEIEGSDLEYTTVPRDESGGENHIADFWEKVYDVPAGSHPKTDDEKDPAPRYAGDGLTLYEEYRGLSVDGSWQELDPRRKDLFVYVSPASRLYGMLDTVAEVTGLDVHRIRASEFGGVRDRVVNRNRAHYATTTQHGLWVRETFRGDCFGRRHRPRRYELSCGVSGKALGGPATPEAIEVILVARGSPDDMTIRTLTHEILHGVAVWHHGSNDDRRHRSCSVLRATQFFEYPDLPAERCAALGGDMGYTYIAHPHGEHSGDQWCPMAYTGAASGYVDVRTDELALAEDGSLLPFRYPDRILGLCVSGNGTLYNGGNRQVGDAKDGRGTCKLRIHVRDGAG